MYGIVGAAISTSFAIIVYNVGRLVIVWSNYKLHPLTMNQLYIFLLFSTVLTIFEVIPTIGINPIVSILLKSAIISLLYFGVIYFFKLNQDIILYSTKILRRK